MKSTYLIILICLLNSCQESKKSSEFVRSKSEIEKKLMGNDSVLKESPTTTDYFLSNITEKLPDSIDLNKMYRFRFNFNNVIDKKNISEEKYFFVYITTENGEFNTINKIEKVNHRIFVLDTNGILEFNFKFKKSGQQILSAVIEDVEFLENKSKSDSISIRKIETSFIKELFVN